MNKSRKAIESHTGKKTSQSLIEQEDKVMIVLDKDRLVAWCSHDGVRLKPFQDPTDGRVKFKGNRGDIVAALEKLQSNPMTPILSYLHHLDNTRQIIFSLKNGGAR